MIRTQFDREANALYIRFKARAKVHSTAQASHDVAVDFDKDGYVIGVEILNAREHVGPDVHKMPSAAEELSLGEASERSELSTETLRGQIHKGKLEARKRGRDWVVTAAALENYLEAVESGRESKPPPIQRTGQKRRSSVKA